ncbi:MAG: glycosyltransferase [Candidatus Dormibacteraeota bacterium]|jgi:glycosyltransferase involved in cell wall biosynthesis|nr:glycosyltransferase [Candidatus Dormibacteraeota bacterium]
MAGQPASNPPTPSHPSVGVIIPTLGRPSLLAAVASALSQSYAPDQVVVVVDGPLELLAGYEFPADPRLQLLTNRPQRGAAAARNVGAAALTTDLVALLDDDDTWMVKKLEHQVAAFLEMRDRGTKHPVIACRSVKVQEGSGRSVVAPQKLIRPGQRPGDYLFRRRQVRPYGATLGHSMLLFERHLTALEPFNVSSVRHDDWDLALRLGAIPGVAFLHVDEVLLRYAVHPGSSSSQAGWAISMNWALDRGRYLTRREQADFLICISGPIALNHGDWRGLAAVLRHALSLGGGSPQAWGFLGALVARRALPPPWLRPRTTGGTGYR